eukprot:305492-Ditylum_brightwellii.AAC.1
MTSIFDGKKFQAPKTIIAAQNVDNMRRGQRLQGTVTPLAQHLGLNITLGPTLVERPRWTAKPASVAALQVLEALHNGTVLLSWWSYTNELCRQLGTSCEQFESPGEMLVIDIEDGAVVSLERKTDGCAANYKWSLLPPKVRAALELLGQNEDKWDEPLVGIDQEKNWKDLSEAERVDLSERGYDELKWESEEDSDNL